MKTILNPVLFLYYLKELYFRARIKSYFTR